MQIFEEKFKEGKVKVKVEIFDDFWYFYYIIDFGDIVYVKIFRKQVQRVDFLRVEKVEVILVFFGV